MNEFLKLQVKQSDLTLDEIGERLGMSRQGVYGILNTPQPRPETVAKMLMVLGWKLPDILALTIGEVYNVEVTQ